MEEEYTLDDLVMQATSVLWDIYDLQEKLEDLNEQIVKAGGDPVK